MILEVDISEVLTNAVVGEDFRCIGQISLMLFGSSVFESGSFFGGGDVAECGAEVLEGHCFEWVDECRGISPSDALTISGFSVWLIDLAQKEL